MSSQIPGAEVYWVAEQAERFSPCSGRSAWTGRLARASALAKDQTLPAIMGANSLLANA